MDATKASRRLLFAVPCIVFALVALLVLASANSTMLDRYFNVLFPLNVAVAAILFVLSAWLCIRLYRQRKAKIFGAQMTARLSVQVVLIAVLPCLLLYAVSSRFIGRSIDSWFNVQVEHALGAGVSLSRTAVSNFQKLTSDRLGLLADSISDTPQVEWETDLPKLCEKYGLSNVIITTSKGEILTTSLTSAVSHFEIPTPDIFSIADQHGSYSSVVENQAESPSGTASVRIVAVAPIENQDTTPSVWLPSEDASPVSRGLKVFSGPSQLRTNAYYLTATEPLPAALEENVISVTDGYRDYQELVLSRNSLQSLFMMSLTVSMLLAVFSAFIAAIAYSQIMVNPLRQLARGTRKVADGNLSPIVEYPGGSEVNALTQSFNDMIRQLSEAQRKVRMRTEQLEETSQYLESVLANLSSAVIVTDGALKVVTANEGAVRIFGAHVLTEGIPFEEISGKVASALRDLQMKLALPGNENASVHREIEIAQLGSQTPMTLFIRASRLQLADSGESGMVLVIDDMTQVISGQRAIAWSEVARRLAHEIKNPLTPIQLAAERLGMKLSGKLGEKDDKLLERSVSTIVSQVSAMKQMVNDFRDYAKLPPAVLQPTDLASLLEDVSSLYHQAGKPVTVEVEPGTPKILADEAQLRQVLHNLVSNSLDALAGKPDGHVSVSVSCLRNNGRPLGVKLSVTDNGSGFTEAILHKSFEPYVTTKATGTGLGLPMVKKIADEHQADIRISNRTDENGTVCGADVTIVFRLVPEN